MNLITGQISFTLKRSMTVYYSRTGFLRNLINHRHHLFRHYLILINPIAGSEKRKRITNINLRFTDKLLKRIHQCNIISGILFFDIVPVYLFGIIGTQLNHHDIRIIFQSIQITLMIPIRRSSTVKFLAVFHQSTPACTKIRDFVLFSTQITLQYRWISSRAGWRSNSFGYTITNTCNLYLLCKCR